MCYGDTALLEPQGICSSLPRNYTLQSFGKKNSYHLKAKERRKPKSVTCLPFLHTELRCYSSNFKI